MTDVTDRTDETAIRIEGLVKRFGSFAALDGLDRVAPGPHDRYLGADNGVRHRVDHRVLGHLELRLSVVNFFKRSERRKVPSHVVGPSSRYWRIHLRSIWSFQRHTHAPSIAHRPRLATARPSPVPMIER